MPCNGSESKASFKEESSSSSSASSSTSTVLKIEETTAIQTAEETHEHHESFELRAYREVDRWKISWEERIRLWNEIIRQQKLTDSEWETIVNEYRQIKSRFVLSREAFAREDLSLIRRWMEKRSSRSCSDGEFRSWITSFYQKNNCSCSKTDYNNLTMIRTGGVITTETKKTVLNTSTTSTTSTANKKLAKKGKKVQTKLIAKSQPVLVKRTTIITESRPVQAQVTIISHTTTGQASTMTSSSSMTASSSSSSM